MAVILDDQFTALGSQWVRTDTGNHLDITPVGLEFDGGLGTPAWGNPGIRTAAGYARTNIGAMSFLVRLTNSGNSGPRLRLSPSATDADAAGAVGFQVEYPYLGTTDSPLPDGRISDERNGSIDYACFIVPRPGGQGGYFLLLSGGVYGTFPSATIVGVSATGLDATLYAHVAGHSSVATLRRARLVDRASLPTALLTRYGPALGGDDFETGATLVGRTTPYGGRAWTVSPGGSATVAGGAVTVTDATVAQFDCGARPRMIDAYVTRVGSADVNVYFRGDGTDAGSWNFKGTSGAVQLWVPGSGSPADQTGAVSLTAGVQYHLRIVDTGAQVKCYVNGVQRLAYASTAQSDQNRVGLGADGGTAQCAELVAWPTAVTVSDELLPTPFVPRPSGPAVTTDAFTAANGTALATYNSQWTVRHGAFEVNTNRARATTAAIALAVATRGTGSAGADHQIGADITLPSGGVPVYPDDPAPSVFARWTDQQNHIMARFIEQGNIGGDTSPEVEVWGYVNNVSEGGAGPIGYANLGTNNLLPGQTHRLDLAVNGHDVAAYWNGALVVQAYTELLTGSDAGIGIRETHPVGQPAWDNVTIHAVPGPAVDDGPPEVTSGPVASPAPQPADTTATIVWTTAIPTRHQVEYGTVDPAVDPAGAYASVTTLNTDPAAVSTAHSVVIPLATGATTWWRAVSISPNGFETLSPGPVPISTVAASSAPSNLVATAASASQITLTWNDNSGDEAGFEVQVSADGGATWAVLATVGPNITRYDHLGLPAQTTRHYRVRGYRTV